MPIEQNNKLIENRDENESAFTSFDGRKAERVAAGTTVAAKVASRARNAQKVTFYHFQNGF